MSSKGSPKGEHSKLWDQHVQRSYVGKNVVNPWKQKIPMLGAERARGNLARFEARKMSIGQIIYGLVHQIKDFDL